MSQLETNTASLQAILDTVNALSDSGDGSTLNYGVGSIAPNSTTMTVSSPLTVSGLPNKPTAVYIYLLSGTSIKSGYYNLMSAFAFVNSYDVTICYGQFIKCTNSSTIAHSGGSPTITLIDDGFTISTSTTSSVAVLGTYRYVYWY